jgi:hypothetical protein
MITTVTKETQLANMLTACTKAIENLDTAIQEAEATPKQDEEGPLVDGWQITLADGHAGYGVYAHMTDYPDEGAIFILEAPQPAPKQEPCGYVILETDYLSRDKHLVGAIDDQTLPVGTPLYAAAPMQAQEQRKPCASMPRCSINGASMCKCGDVCNDLVDVYTDPQATLSIKPLTRSEKNRIWSSCGEAKTLSARASLFGTKIEQHHGIKEQP